MVVWESDNENIVTLLLENVDATNDVLACVNHAIARETMFLLPLHGTSVTIL